jgi:hypothetical protein
VVNQSLGNILRNLVIEHHNQWDQILPRAKFAYNDSPKIRIGKSPFKIVYGVHPRGISDLMDLKHDEFKSAGEKDFVA